MDRDTQNMTAITGVTHTLTRFSVAIMFGLLSHSVWASAPDKAAGIKKATIVGVEPVTEQVLNRQLPLIGNLIARQGLRLQSKVEATLTGINMQPSGQVKQGQWLIQLDDAQPKAALAEAQANAVDAERKLQELSRLAALKAISNTELESQRAAVQVAKAKVASAQSTVNNYKITAPFSGQVGLYTLTVGQLISKDTVITSLDDLAQMTLDISVPEKFLSQVSIGSKVLATTEALPKQNFTGTVVSKDVRLDENTLNGKVRVSFDNPQQQLRPGMLVRAKIMLDTQKRPVIPARALLFQGNQRYVFVIEEGKAVQRQIHVERIYDDQVEVAKGLKAGELLVVDGTVKVRNGMAVEAKLITPSTPNADSAPQSAAPVATSSTSVGQV
ncbi:MAG: efflux RND transporter periplasmic adaptor subunit [Plesiomonas sp.]|uniref:efflux RND transporter periplasmic adaptor subunit n=1 Tax=Plesiomonas sp. TaxID=2486279 RepID=UPI003F3C47D4